MKTRPCRPGDILASKPFDYDINYVIEVIEPTEHPSCGVTTDHDVKLKLSIYLPVKVLESINPIEILGECTGTFWGIQHSNTHRKRTKIFFTRDIFKTVVDVISLTTNECWKAQEAFSMHKRSVLDQKNARDKIYSQFMITEA